MRRSVRSPAGQSTTSGCVPRHAASAADQRDERHRSPGGATRAAGDSCAGSAHAGARSSASPLQPGRRAKVGRIAAGSGRSLEGRSRRRATLTLRGELRLEVTEPGEGLGGTPFLAHEDAAAARARAAAPPSPRRSAAAPASEVEPLAKGAVADLIVVLQEVDERASAAGARCARRARRAACSRGLPLVGEALGEAAAQERERCRREILVVAVALAGEQHVQAVMRVVVPLRVDRPCGVVRAAEQVGGVVAIFSSTQVHVAGRAPGPARTACAMSRQDVRLARRRGSRARRRGAGRRSDTPRSQ